MNLATATQYHYNERPIREWFKHLDKSLGYDHVTYILNGLYSIIISTNKCGSCKKKFIEEIESFERDCDLPQMFSLFTPEYLITELEDLQHLYPVSRRIINLPTFVK